MSLTGNFNWHSPCAIGTATSLLDIGSNPKKGDVFYNIYKVSGTSLYVGNVIAAEDGTTSAKRPTSYDPVLTKQ